MRASGAPFDGGGGSRLPDEFVNAVRTAATTETVLGLLRCKLKPDGPSRRKARCPLPVHPPQTGKTPPFTLYDDGGWKCYSCGGKGGDGIALWAAVHTYNLDTAQGLRATFQELAGRLGIRRNGSENGSAPAPKASRKPKLEEPWKPWPALPESTKPPSPYAREGVRITARALQNADGKILAWHVERRDISSGRKLRSSWSLGLPPGEEKEVWKLQGRHLQDASLYGTELLSGRPDETIFVTEGEPAADALREACGALALGTVTGADTDGKTHSPEALQDLAGRDVVVLPDRDKAGHAHALATARNLSKAGAKSVRIASGEWLATLPRKAGSEGKETAKDGADAVEWLALFSDHEGEDIRQALGEIPTVALEALEALEPAAEVGEADALESGDQATEGQPENEDEILVTDRPNPATHDRPNAAT